MAELEFLSFTVVDAVSADIQAVVETIADSSIVKFIPLFDGANTQIGILVYT